jgi:hypothetical protein
MYGNAVTAGQPVVVPEWVYFQDEPTRKVQCYFMPMKMGTFNAEQRNIKLSDAASSLFRWDMDICIIPTTYKNNRYFKNYEYGSIGIAPTHTTDDSLLKR